MTDCNLHTGDCLDLLTHLVAERGAPFDHVITDPPYEDIHHAHHAAGTINRSDGRAAPRTVTFTGIDAIRADAAQAMVDASAGWVLVFCLAEGVRPWHDALTRAGARWHGTALWLKPDACPQFAGLGPARGFECIACAWAGTGRRRWNRRGQRGVYTALTVKGGHACAKPLGLMEALVGDFTRPGQIICDPFMGSGTTGVAALNQHRHFTGIEIDAETADQARRRLTTAAAMPALPLPDPVPAYVQHDLTIGAA